MYALFDIGGTKTRVALSEDLRSFETKQKFDTPVTYAEGIETLIAEVRTLVGDRTIDGLAGGIRGVLNHEKSGIVTDPGGKLSNWAGRPIVADLEAVFGAPAYLENDTAIVGLGEAHFGAGRGHKIVAYHTVSTGVGGARIVHGAVDVSHSGFEPGHQILDIDGSLFPDLPSRQLSLENLVSGEALEQRRGVKPYEIPQDDPVWDELAGYLAYGLKNTVVYWSPDVIVLGGSMIVGDPRIFREDIIRHTEAALTGLTECPPIADAALTDEGGLFGAMVLITQKHKVIAEA